MARILMVSFAFLMLAFPALGAGMADTASATCKDYETGSHQDMLDIAAYYAYLPRVPSNNLDPTIPAPAIVTTGAPMRNIAPCGSCHGDVDNKAGSPWLGMTRVAGRPFFAAPAGGGDEAGASLAGSGGGGSGRGPLIGGLLGAGGGAAIGAAT